MSVEAPLGLSPPSPCPRPRRAVAAGPPVHRLTTLQWAVGVFSALIGALALVSPGQFAGPFFSALQPHLMWVGFGWLLAGIALVACVVAGGPRPWVISCHFAAAATLLTFVYNASAIGAWPGTVNYLVLALGTAAAPFLRRWELPPAAHRGSLLAVVFGTLTLAYGATMVFFPEQYGATIYDPIRPSLPLYGFALLIAGGALVLAQVPIQLTPAVFKAAHVAIFVAYVPHLAILSVPMRAWSGILLYGGVSLFVASLPWTGHALRRVDARSFSSRLALSFALAAALPMILVAGMITLTEDKQDRDGIQAGMETIAVLIANSIADDVGALRTAASLLAARPDLMNLSQTGQRDALRRYNDAYPDALAFILHDPTGKEISRSDGRPTGDVTPGHEGPITELVRANAPVAVAYFSPSLPGAAFAILAPVRDADGRVVGAVGADLPSRHLSPLLGQSGEMQGRMAYLVDGSGRAIAHPDARIAESFADLSDMPAVSRLLNARPESGVIGYNKAGSDTLAAYARVTGLGWSVVVEQPSSAALATVQAGRDAAFGILLVAVLAASLAGVLVARRLSGPLAALSRATGRLARGEIPEGLPAGGTVEIQSLLTDFASMADQLAARAAQQALLLEQLEAKNLELQDQAAALQVQYEELRVANAELTRATAVAEAAVQARNDFLSLAAHELKTPVTGMMGFAQILLHQHERQEAIDPARLERALRVIDRQAHKLSALIGQLLDITRIEAGRLPFARERADVARIVRDVAMLAAAANSKHSFSVASPSSLKALVDPLRIEQVVTNLVENAVRYSPRGGPIHIDLATRDSTLEVTVRDHGLGVPPEHRAHIFDRFYQAHVKEHLGGLGLGLYISREIVTLHGGAIAVDCPPEGGTRFVVSLPIGEPVATERGD